jgi:hypothetical protein
MARFIMSDPSIRKTVFNNKIFKVKRHSPEEQTYIYWKRHVSAFLVITRTIEFGDSKVIKLKKKG